MLKFLRNGWKNLSWWLAVYVTWPLWPGNQRNTWPHLRYSIIDGWQQWKNLCLVSRVCVTVYPDSYHICVYVRVQLTRYSGDDQLVYQYQPIIDQSIPLINSMIKSVNARHGLPTPNIAHTIHHCHEKRGKYRTRYCQLMDGCHPDAATFRCWLIKKILGLD